MAVTLKVINDFSDNGPSVHNPLASPYFLGLGSETLLPSCSWDPGRRRWAVVTDLGCSSDRAVVAELGHDTDAAQHAPCGLRCFL